MYAGRDRPEIIVPRTDRLGDYATVVSRLIRVFAQVADQDERTVYRSLVTGDRDVVRFRGEGVAGRCAWDRPCNSGTIVRPTPPSTSDPMNIAVRLLERPFDPLAALSGWGRKDAAQAQFIGRVRGAGVDGAALRGLWLEHYPGMTETMLEAICREELERHGAGAALVWHRVGTVAVGDPIVLVATAGDGRGQALASCQAILESLKHHAPFWKKELGHAGERWIPGNMPYGSRQPE